MNKKAKPRKKAVKRKPAAPRCEEFVLLLAEYWEGDADASLKAEIEEHITCCPDCAEVFHSYSRTVRTFRNLPRVATPNAVHRQLWEDLFRQIRALDAYPRK